jgi:Na+:H+ antiporter, NhaA family
MGSSVGIALGSHVVRGALREFVRSEAIGGVVLLVGVVAALIWANADASGYEALWHRDADVLGLGLDLRHWINDGLMVVFFFVVGLEIKRELVAGELRDRRAALLPVVAAVGGVALPALIFVALTAGTGDTAGWAVPAATDIAFAVGVLALLGDRVPSGAKLFLLTIAIVDDIAAIAIIAMFYSESIALGWLLAAVATLAITFLMRDRVPWITVYVLIGALIWVEVHESGVPATIAGVALGLMTPARPVRGRAVLEQLEHRLHPFSALLIVPLFALANAGVPFGDGALSDALGDRLAWAIALGLVVGKAIGISGATALGRRLGWGVLPEGVTGRHVAGLALLGGIGFTVSLFIAQLAYDDPHRIAVAKIGILIGSAIAAVLGAAWLARGSGRGRRGKAYKSIP